MLNICIGIPSWLPDDQKDRLQRINRLNRLIKQLSDLFNLPIIFIAQNWKDYKPTYTNTLHIYQASKLGIMKARNLLRNKFLELGYDYLIMFDDDAIIECMGDANKQYIELLNKNPNGFCFIDGNGSSKYTKYNDSQLNLCAISRHIYELEPLPKVDPQKSEAFEDRIWSTMLHFKYSALEFHAPKQIKCVHFKNPEINKLGGEVNSTWAKAERYNWDKLRQNTADIEDYIAIYKDLPDLDVFLNKKADSDGNNYMQLIGNCSDIGYLGDNRIKGPTDNVLTKGNKTVEYLLDNTYLEHLKSDTPITFKRIPSFNGDLTVGYDYDFAQIIHNVPTEQKYIDELTKRIKTFNTFYFCLRRYDNFYFVACLNMYDIDNKTNLLIDNHFENIIKYLKTRNILDKTLFVQTKTVNVKGTANWWAKNIEPLIKQYNLKIITINDNQLHNEKSHEQFIIKTNVCLNMVDLVVPYVDSADTNWQKLFNEYNPTKGKEIEAINAKNRFRGQGDFFRFFFRCLEANLPWLNKIFILVQNKSQIPSWLNTNKVKVITHEQFIPKEFLPTFNSCTIEMFLHNIPGLSERFIYVNDDIFIVKKTTKEDFFWKDKLRENFVTAKATGLFGQHCNNALTTIYSSDASFIRPDHEAKPYRKSSIKNCFILHNQKILDSITRFRDAKNYNCYLYSLYQLKSGLINTASIKSCCLNAFNRLALDSNTTVCLNDANPAESIYDDNNLRGWFLAKFPNKSKFELNDLPTNFYKNYKKESNHKDVRADGRPDSYLYF